jgi:hypothetical protein
VPSGGRWPNLDVFVLGSHRRDGTPLTPSVSTDTTLTLTDHHVTPNGLLELTYRVA